MFPAIESSSLNWNIEETITNFLEGMKRRTQDDLYNALGIFTAQFDRMYNFLLLRSASSYNVYIYSNKALDFDRVMNLSITGEVMFT